MGKTTVEVIWKYKKKKTKEEEEEKEDQLNVSKVINMHAALTDVCLEMNSSE